MRHAFVTAALSAAAILGTGAARAQLTGTLQKIKETGTIQLGGRDASFPFSYKVSDGDQPIGFSADLCAKVVEAVKTRLAMPHLKVGYTMVTPANRMALVQNGTIDLECSTTTHTVARAQQVGFAPTHFVAGIAVAVRKDSGITSLAELEGKTIATVTGSTSIQLLRGYRRNQKVDFSEVSGRDISNTFLLLSSGRAAAMVLDDVQLSGLIAMSGQPDSYRILSERLREEPYAFMYRKDDPQFKALVDQALGDAMKSGQAGGLYTKWFQQPVPPAQVNLNLPMSPAIRNAYQNPDSRGI
jgi:glutamate/aspartate transport system substrate-binding protein